MIISFKYKFIFVKTYKTAGSSIESYLYKFLDQNDIYAHTGDNIGINCWGEFDKENKLKEYYDETTYKDKVKKNLKFFAHMPIWLIEERLEPYSKKFNYDIFNNFFKFGVIRNPYDLVVSDYYWRNISNKNRKTSFEDILKEIKENTFASHGLLNLNKLMDKNLRNVLCDKIIKYENLNEELSVIFKKLNIPFSGKLDIYKKKAIRDRDYKNFYNNESRKLIKKIFWKEFDYFDYLF